MGKLVIKHRTYYYVTLTNLVICALSAIGQNNAQMLNKTIVINSTKIRVDSLLNAFSKQTQIDFSFNSKKINPAKVIPVRHKSQSLAEWLSILQHSIDIQYTLLGDHIILIDNTPLAHQKPVVKKFTLNSDIKQITGNTIINQPAPTIDSGLTSLHSSQSEKPLPLLHRPQYLRAGTEALNDTMRFAANQVHDTVTINAPVQIDPARADDSTGTVISENNPTKRRGKSSKKKQNIFEGGTTVIIGIGAAISIPGSFSKGETSSALGAGFDIKVEKIFSKKISGTLGIGYNYFTGSYTYYNYVGPATGYAVGKNFANLPVLAGLKYYFNRKFYVSAETGILVGASSNTGSHLAISPAAGYFLPVAKKTIDIGIKLIYVKPGFGTPESTSLQNGGYSFWSLRIAYLF